MPRRHDAKRTPREHKPTETIRTRRGSATSPAQAASSRSGPPAPLVGVVMGSRSDWETMQHASAILDTLGVPHECAVVSAHRTPDWLMEYAGSALARGLRVIIAGAGGAAHLPGMCASKTRLPVLGVPIMSTSSEPHSVKGLDALLSIVQMPAGVPVGTLAIGKAGAVNAGLLAASILALTDPALARRVQDYRDAQTADVMRHRDPRKD